MECYPLHGMQSTFKKIIFSRLTASTRNRLNLMKTIVHEYLAGLQIKTDTTA